MKNTHNSTTHGLRSHPLYMVWANMKTRTTNENNRDYINYGGRGIRVCKEWKDDFSLFHRWSIENGYGSGLTIDRIDNDGDYEPLNCRWTTRTMQSRNTRVLRSDNKSGYRGVCRPSGNSKCIAQIFVNGKRKYLGSFHTAFGAACAYDRYVVDNGLGHTINGVVND